MTADAVSAWPPAPDAPRLMTPDITHLLAPNASSWTYEGTNSYVIARGGESVLIDPGIENPDHLEALRQAGRAGGSTVTAVLLTHDHPDHSDGARTLADSLGVPIRAMSTRFADELIAPSDTLRIGDLDVQLVHTPGHSDDSVCLWFEQQRTILTGDTLLGARSSGVMGKLGELLDSLELLRELVGEESVLALPGHGPAFTDLTDSAARVIAVRRRRIDEVRSYIAEGDTTLLALTHRLYPQHQGSRAMFAASTVISTVQYLVDQPGEAGIADPAQRAQIIAEIDAFQEQMAARAREHAAAVSAERADASPAGATEPNTEEPREDQRV